MWLLTFPENTPSKSTISQADIKTRVVGICTFTFYPMAMISLFIVPPYYTIELLHLTQLIGEYCHIPTFLFLSDFGVNLRGTYILVSKHLGKDFYGNSVGQADFRRHSMAAGMPRNLFFDTAKSDDFLGILASG